MRNEREKDVSLIWEQSQKKQRPADREEMRRRQERRKRRRRRARMARAFALTVVAAGCLILACGLWKLGSYIWSRADRSRAEPVSQMEEQEQQLIEENASPKPVISENFLTPNEYSRPQEPLTEVENIYVHYTANAGTSAAQNRSYFENLGITGETSASAHFVIGYEGEIVQCLPLDEIGYAVKEHNYNSISIECCYLDESGVFTDATYQSLIELLGWLLNEYNLGPSAVARHYDASGKLCPLYYVEHEDAWVQLIEDLETYIEKLEA